jgi:hypothetical protein
MSCTTHSLSSSRLTYPIVELTHLSTCETESNSNSKRKTFGNSNNYDSDRNDDSIEKFKINLVANVSEVVFTASFDLLACEEVAAASRSPFPHLC